MGGGAARRTAGAALGMPWSSCSICRAGRIGCLVHACMCMPASNEAAAIVSGHSLLPLQGARYVRDARSFPGRHEGFYTSRYLEYSQSFHNSIINHSLGQCLDR